MAVVGGGGGGAPRPPPRGGGGAGGGGGGRPPPPRPGDGRHGGGSRRRVPPAPLPTRVGVGRVAVAAPVWGRPRRGQWAARRRRGAPPTRRPIRPASGARGSEALAVGPVISCSKAAVGGGERRRCSRLVPQAPRTGPLCGYRQPLTVLGECRPWLVHKLRFSARQLGQSNSSST